MAESLFDKALSDIKLWHTVVTKLKTAEDRGDGLALSNPEVQALLKMLKTLSAGPKNAKPDTSA